MLAGLSSPAWALPVGAGMFVGGLCVIAHDQVFGSADIIKDSIKTLDPLKQEIENLKKSQEQLKRDFNQ